MTEILVPHCLTDVTCSNKKFGKGGRKSICKEVKKD